MIYLDNAATSFPKPESVYRAVDHFNRHVGTNPGRSGYALAREASRIVAETRQVLARLFNAKDPNRIVFTANATESLNLALKGLLGSGDHVVTTVTDHNSLLRPLRSLEDRAGVLVTRVTCDEFGAVSPDDIAKALRPDTRLVCMTHASNVTGTIHDVVAIGEHVRQNGTLFMLDAAQTAGCVRIDVQDMGIDLLAFTGHKGLLGPQGTGGLYVRPGLELRPLREGGTGSESWQDRQPAKMPDRYEGGTLNTPGLAGLGAGARFILDTGIDAITKHEQQLTEHLVDRLRGIKGIKLYSPTSKSNRTGVVSLTLQALPPLNLAHLLDVSFGIAVRSGLHCAPLIHKHLGTADTGTLRISVGYFNTVNDIDSICAALEMTIAQLR